MAQAKRKVTIPATQAADYDEIISSINHSVPFKQIEVQVVLVVAGVMDRSTFRRVKFIEADYDELMSEFPTWSKKKPAGQFRQEDILKLMSHIEKNGGNPYDDRLKRQAQRRQQAIQKAQSESETPLTPEEIRDAVGRSDTLNTA